MNMFKLDSRLINEVLYSMENQEKISYIDIETSEISYFDKDSTQELPDNLYPLPEWSPVEGFKVMDEFVSKLHNPIVKEELRLVLKSGHGVFRKFKNVLKENPEVQKLWFNFKKEAMKSLIFSWYNQIREYTGLESLNEGYIEEEDEELINFDFDIKPGTPQYSDFFLTSDRLGFYEMYNQYPRDVREDLYDRKRDGLLTDSIFDTDITFFALTPSGEVSGFTWAIEYVLGEKFRVLELLQIYVKPSYRGLGIGKLLLERVISIYKENGGQEFVLTCPQDQPWIVKHLENTGFTVYSQELSLRS
jgi:GNAT superfamily N-acetyltransferase